MGRKSGAKVNSREVAELVGVSRSTVSKVLNGYPNISEETRAKVLAVVKERGYYPNLSGRMLTGKGSETIGLFFITHSDFSNDVLVNYMLSRVIESAATYGYHILTYILPAGTGPRAISTIKQVFRQRRVDGGVFIGIKNNESIIDELTAEGFPIGVFDLEVDPSTAGPRVVVNTDDIHVSHQAIDYLFSLGHRKIAIMVGDLERNAGIQKRDGFLAGLADHGLRIPDDWVISTDFTTQAGYQSTRRFLKTASEHPTAIAAINDHAAFGALRALTEAGLSVPKDISIIGMDGHPLGEYSHPPLTTFRFDFEAMMLVLVSGVIGLVERGTEPKSFVFGGVLVERDSCARIQ